MNAAMELTTRRRRRGSAYVLVLGSALIVMVIGLSSVMVARIQHRTSDSAAAASEARFYAQSICEGVVGSTVVFQSWRTQWNISSGQLYGPMPLGRGTTYFKLVDEIDGDLLNDTDQPVRIYATGEVGNAVQRYSVLAEPRALNCLWAPVLACGTFTVNAGTRLTVTGGPAYCSTSGQYATAIFTVMLPGVVNGDVKAQIVLNPEAITGRTTQNAPQREVPPSTTMAYYQSLATPISIPGRLIDKQILSHNIDPYGTCDPNGLYSINATGDFTIRNTRIEGTLVVNMSLGCKLILGGGIYWEPHRPDYPALIVNGRCEIGIEGPLSEPNTLVNFNPTDLPYQGQANTTLLDVYPGVIKGLVHVVGGPVILHEVTRIEGALISTGPIEVQDSPTIAGGDNLALHPPKRYRSYRLNVVQGTWRRELNP